MPPETERLRHEFKAAAVDQDLRQPVKSSMAIWPHDLGHTRAAWADGFQQKV
jgi:hypothetical protein